MLEITAYWVISTLYIIPSSILVYNALYSWAQGAISPVLWDVPLMAFLGDSLPTAAASAMYLLFVVIYFITMYFLFKLVIIKYIYVFQDIDIDEKQFFASFSRGQKGINSIAKILIFIIVTAHLLLKVFDIKLFVLCMLSSVFVYSSKKARVRAEERDSPEIKPVEDNREDTC